MGETSTFIDLSRSVRHKISHSSNPAQPKQVNMKLPLPAIVIAFVVTIDAEVHVPPHWPCPFNCFYTACAMGGCWNYDSGTVLDTKCFCANEQLERESYSRCMEHLCPQSDVDALSSELDDACHRNRMGQVSSVNLVDLAERMKNANGGEMGKMLAGRQYSGMNVSSCCCRMRSR